MVEQGEDVTLPLKRRPTPPLTDEELRLFSRNISLVGWSDVRRLIEDLLASRAKVESLLAACLVQDAEIKRLESKVGVQRQDAYE